MKTLLIGMLFLSVSSQVLMSETLAEMAKRIREEKQRKTAPVKVLTNGEVGEPSDAKPTPDDPMPEPIKNPNLAATPTKAVPPCDIATLAPGTSCASPTTNIQQRKSASQLLDEAMPGQGKTTSTKPATVGAR